MKLVYKHNFKSVFLESQVKKSGTRKKRKQRRIDLKSFSEVLCRWPHFLHDVCLIPAYEQIWNIAVLTIPVQPVREFCTDFFTKVLPMTANTHLSPSLIAFARAQPVFFVGTAGAGGAVNVSPKGMDTLRIVDGRRIVWLNLSGSGNETAAHVLENGRMTLMFCAFEGEARILRVYGTACTVHPRDSTWGELIASFPELAGSRQIFDMEIERVQISCGTGVPLMKHVGERAPQEMLPFYAEMPPGGLAAYWARKNAVSIDGKPTGTVAQAPKGGHDGKK